MTNKRRADLILLAVALCFVASAIALHLYPDVWWTRLLFYMTEAGLVGGLADWYAVTALFRHPLGIPGKHTAIVPRNRDKLIDGVVTMVETQLLPPGKLKEKLEEASIMNTVIEWLDDRFPRGTLAKHGWRWMAGLLKQLDFSKTSGDWDERLKLMLLHKDITPYAGKALNALLQHGQIHVWLDRIVEEIALRTDTPATKELILQLLRNEQEKQLNQGNALTRFFKKAASIFAEESDALNLDDAAEVLSRDLVQFVNDLRSHDHELRLLLIEMLRKLAADLGQRPDLSATVESWKQEVLERISFAPSIEALLASLNNLPEEDVPDSGDNHSGLAGLRKWVGGFIEDYWEQFKQDESKKAWIERYIKLFLNKVIDTEHRLIGQIVRDTLGAFTEKRLISFIEDKVGEDLSRIRINGSLVGAGIGALLYGLLHGIYEPILQAFSR